MKKSVTKAEIIKLSKEIVHGFYSRDVQDFMKYLSDDFVWIGAFDFQFATNKEDFLKIVSAELDSPTFTMSDEEFMLISKSTGCYTICAKFKLLTQTQQKEIIRTHTRLTLVWRFLGDELKLIHIHGSNAQDIPMSFTLDNYTKPNEENFSSFLSSVYSNATSMKIPFKDENGKYRYVEQSDILYLEANTQATNVYTKDEKIKVHGLLRENTAKMPSNFYRTHKCYTINSELVTSLERYTVSLNDEINLPISKEKYINFRTFLNNNLAEKVK